MSSALLTLAGSGGEGSLTGLQFNEYVDATNTDTVSVNIGDYQEDRVVIILTSVSNDTGGANYPNVMNMDGGTTEVSDTAFTTSGGVSGPIFAISDRGAFSGKTSINVNVEMNSSANVTRLIVASYAYYGGTATPDITEINDNESNFTRTRSLTLSTPTPDFMFCLAHGGESDIAYTAPSGATQQSIYTIGADDYARAQHIEDPASGDLTSTVEQASLNFLLLYAAKFNLK